MWRVLCLHLSWHWRSRGPFQLAEVWRSTRSVLLRSAEPGSRGEIQRISPGLLVPGSRGPLQPRSRGPLEPRSRGSGFSRTFGLLISSLPFVTYHFPDTAGALPRCVLCGEECCVARGAVWRCVLCDERYCVARGIVWRGVLCGEGCCAVRCAVHGD